MKGLVVFAVLLIAAAMVTVARSGHEFPVYPSYYPHEIRIEAISPERAAESLHEGKIQAYIGREPRFITARPESIRAVESLGSYVVVRVNPESSRLKDKTSACMIARAVVHDLAGRSGELIVHPYPVTPFHGDYLYHVDLADAAKARLLGSSATSVVPAIPGLRVRATSALTKSLVGPHGYAQDSEWDVAVEEVSAADLVASATTATNGWVGPPWARTGWFQAMLLLGGASGEPRAPDRVQADRQRLEAGAYDSDVERINLERELVSELAAGCYSMVAGYTVKREFINTEYSAGIENIGFDSIEGLNSPTFIRTAKLKDFPWNGWLSLGTDSPPAAAWNPVAGFTDKFGRLMWSALGDPALLPAPYDARWMLNRISDVQSVPSR